MKTIITVVFVIQLLIQFSIKFGFVKSVNTTPMYEDLITTLLFCTLMIVYTIYDTQG